MNLADACFFLMDHYEGEEHVNVGTGIDITIGDLAIMVREIVAPEVEIEFDRSKPDGAPQKLLNIDRIRALGWSPRIPLRQGIEDTYRWYLQSDGDTAGGRGAPVSVSST